MQEHGPVDLLQNVESNFDLQLRRDADDVRVERRVVELAEREAVGHDRLPQGMAIRKDVGRLQQRVMAEPTDGAALLVSAEHALAKAPLVQALPPLTQMLFISRLNRIISDLSVLGNETLSTVYRLRPRGSPLKVMPRMAFFTCSIIYIFSSFI